MDGTVDEDAAPPERVDLHPARVRESRSKSHAEPRDLQRLLTKASQGAAAQAAQEMEAQDGAHPGGEGFESVEASDDVSSKSSSDKDDAVVEAGARAHPHAGERDSYASTAGSSGYSRDPVAPRMYFHSRRLNKEELTELKKPWQEGKKKRDPLEWWANALPWMGVVLGVILGGLIIWDGYRTVPRVKHCLLYQDDFSSGALNDAIWTKEVEAGGFGNGQFEMTTNTDENVFVENGMLVIKPTLQDPELMTTNNVINLTKSALCTSANSWDCVAATNVTNGTVVNPVKSARINTKAGATIRYGRIEVEARLPAGDWLWPAIWMLPVKPTYGTWPASGEIDIMESRGNNYTYPLGGNNFISSTIHWGPDAENDRWWRSFRKHKAVLSTYNDGFHAFGLEWTPNYLFTYIDNRMMQVHYSKFDGPLWKEGKFPESDANGTMYVDLWSQTGRFSTPFDQDFYLILNVAVGGTNAWFEDGVAAKPWVDASSMAKRDFWAARDRWYPSWKEGGARLEVRKVSIWQQQGYRGCGEEARPVRRKMIRK